MSGPADARGRWDGRHRAREAALRALYQMAVGELRCRTALALIATAEGERRRRCRSRRARARSRRVSRAAPGPARPRSTPMIEPHCTTGGSNGSRSSITWCCGWRSTSGSPNPPPRRGSCSARPSSWPAAYSGDGRGAVRQRRARCRVSPTARRRPYHRVAHRSRMSNEAGTNPRSDQRREPRGPRSAGRRRPIRTASTPRTPWRRWSTRYGARRRPSSKPSAGSRPRPPAASSASAASARPASWCSRTAARGSRSTCGRTCCPSATSRSRRLLDFGDIVGVAGHLFRTKTNELSIWASSLDVPGQVLLPLPEKWHGLQRRRDPLPPALRRPDREPRGRAACSRRAAAWWRRCASS